MRRAVTLAAAFAAIAGAIALLEQERNDRFESNGGAETIVTGDREDKALRYENAKEITTPDGFINVPSISVGELVGKDIVLIDFWTYSCINCQRTTPYLNAWHEKYSNQGLTIIGIHTPEFAFEKEYENVLRAVEKFGIKYPVVLDNDYSTWTAYKNRYWPRKYLVDIDGYIVYDHIGEGAYEETERKIQELLEERMARLSIEGEIDKSISEPGNVRTPEARSPEVYFGALRNSLLGNGERRTIGVQTFSEPNTTSKNTLYLVGEWDITEEYATNRTANEKILFRYDAKNVNLVARADTPVTIEVLRDGLPLGNEAGKDVTASNGKTYVTVEADGLYELINDMSAATHTLELIITNPGLEAFTFTFG